MITSQFLFSCHTTSSISMLRWWSSSRCWRGPTSGGLIYFSLLWDNNLQLVGEMERANLHSGPSYVLIFLWDPYIMPTPCSVGKWTMDPHLRRLRDMMRNWRGGVVHNIFQPNFLLLSLAPYLSDYRGLPILAYGFLGKSRATPTT
jgi:hypothetical protein